MPTYAVYLYISETREMLVEADDMTDLRRQVQDMSEYSLMENSIQESWAFDWDVLDDVDFEDEEQV